MKVLHLRHHRWVKHRKINSKLTFASPIGDAVRHCKEDFCKHHNVLPEMVDVEVNEPYITCSYKMLFAGNRFEDRKVYKVVDYTRSVPQPTPEVLPKLFD